MITAESFSVLLSRSESKTLDFKLINYDLGKAGEDGRVKEKKRADFSKDMLALANGWTDEPKYIVVGAKRHRDGTLEAPGITVHPDSSDLAQAMEGLVHPCPRFHYQQVDFEGRQFGVIEIENDKEIGPFFATKDVGGGDGGMEPTLRKNALYCRRDAKNVEASPSEQQAIWNWFRRGQASPNLEFPQEGNWQQLSRDAQLGLPGVNHILVLALDQSSKLPELSFISAIDWRFVIDLDPASQLSGALKYFSASKTAHRALHVVKPESPLMGEISRSTTWYFANGLQVADDPLPESKHRDWLARFGKPLRDKIESIAASCSGPTAVVAICESKQRGLVVQKAIDEIIASFGERATCVAITEDQDDWSALEQHGVATVVPMSPLTFLHGLEARAKALSLGIENVVQLPATGGAPRDISGDELAYLEEDLELVALNCGVHPPEGIEPVKNYMRGGEISWFDLGLQTDVEREKTGDLYKVVEKDLEARRTNRINIYHEPGAGGSTIARRVAWQLHLRYPTVLLRKCSARETSERIARIYQLTGQSVLILREGSKVQESEADQLAGLLAGKQVPSVMLQVLRRYQLPATGSRNVYLQGQLSTAENHRFRVAFEHVAPTRQRAISLVANGPPSSRTPFLFGLAAFESDFAGLRTFVQNHIEKIPTPQLKVVQFLALAYVYGQQALAESHFGDLLGLPPTRPVDFTTALCDEARGLIIDQADGGWRPMHNLIGAEILELTLSQNSNDTRLWKMGLGGLTRDFITFCRGSSPVGSDELEQIAEQVCVRRNDAELMEGASAGESRFSRLVTDLPTTESRLVLFNYLVETFPSNPHFWAHLGRFHSIERRDFSEAEKALDHAIGISSEDHVLHHMKGMVLRNLAMQMIEEKKEMDVVVTTAKQATECFNEARRLDPDDEYAYIAEAQTLLRILDYARGGKPAAEIIARENVDPWLREAFERIENLLSAVREQRRGEVPSEYEGRCRAELDVLYGAHDQALQRWDQLLQRRGPSGQPLVHAPPIRRQIVWLQLARCERQWSRMSQKHLKRSLELLEENIQQEPGEDKNIRLWVQASRFQATPPTISIAAERISMWRVRGDSLDASYYLFALKVLEALDGSAIAANDVQRYVDECKVKARFRRDRTRSFEWVGIGNGLRRLVHQDDLGGWNVENDFWNNTDPLLRVQGVVSRIYAPQSGEIELRHGMKAFFAPAKAGMAHGRDENRLVSFFLGFSYEGLRAWSVEAA